MVTATPTPPGDAEPMITLMGTVMDVSTSARIILLERASRGYRLIALGEGCEPASTAGEPVALRDIRPGMTVQARGRPGESEALIATAVSVALPLPSDPTADPDGSEAGESVPRDVERIEFAAGITQTIVGGVLAQGEVGRYVLRAMAGQRMILALQATGEQVTLGLVGDDGQVLLSGRVAGSRYDGFLPAPQDYTIWVGANGGSGTIYTLAIILPPLSMTTGSVGNQGG
jgi:hypothetical protein